MTPVALHLLRHGEPVRPGLLLGRTDDPATPAGIAACAAQGRALGPMRLVSSDLARARASAEAIGTPLVDPRWRELDFGEWDGCAAATLAPDALAAFWRDPDAHPPPRGERWSALVARVGAAVAALPPEPVLVVTHAGAMRAALAVLCGFGPRETFAVALPYACLLTLEVWPEEPRSARIVGLRA